MVLVGHQDVGILAATMMRRQAGEQKETGLISDFFFFSFWKSLSIIYTADYLDGL